MTTPTEIVRRLGLERFAEILAASPKAFREELFRRAGIRTKASAFSVNTASKNTVRSEKLLNAMKDGLDLGDEVVEEIIRNYLYTRRSLLGDALDHFSIAHDNGLTDTELDFIGKLTPEKGDELKSKLIQAKGHSPADVELYMAFMQIPGA